MAYTINLTDGNVFATIADGTVNTSSSMTLVGKNYAGYGEFLDENFIHLLENASNTTAPAAPLTGQLWWDKTNTLLKVYNGSSFIVVGPAFTSSEGTAGAIPGTVNDSGGSPHYITSIYVNNDQIAIVSKDAAFTPASPTSTNFPTIYPGITVTKSGSGVHAGNVVNTGNLTLGAGGATTVTLTSTGGNVAGYVSASGNVTGGNLLSGGLASITGNITGGNLLSGGLVSITGNITGGNLISAGAFSAATTANVTGNINGGNLRTVGLITATGNITGGNVISDALVSGVAVTATGNVTGGNLVTGGLVTATGNIISSANVSGTYFLGNGSQLTGISAAVTVTKFTNGSSEGNIGASGGNINFNVGGTSNVVVMSTTGLTATGISVPSITKTGSNAVGNIGSSSNYFNQVFATATTALYADVAERFHADELLEPGTVVELGGANEITKSRSDLSDTVFGVISTLPAFTMNGGAGENDTHPAVAMTGRVPVMVTGIINKGDRLVSAGNGIARAARPGEATSFNVIGRSLVAKTTEEIGTVEAIVSIK